MATRLITAIDTDGGKTVAVGLMARYLLDRDARVITAKLAQTGCEGHSGDIVLHRKLMGMEPVAEDDEGLTCPYLFGHPCSPHLAAKLENTRIDPDRIAACVDSLGERFDEVLVEGVGGVLVPLNRETLLADFLSTQGWETIVVTSGKLGSINHTLLTLEALRHRGVPIGGIVYNLHIEGDPLITKDTRELLREECARLGFPGRFVEMPFIKDFSSPPAVDFSAILEAR